MDDFKLILIRAPDVLQDRERVIPVSRRLARRNVRVLNEGKRYLVFFLPSTNAQLRDRCVIRIWVDVCYVEATIHQHQ